MFDEIVVPLDGSDGAARALDAAERLAQRWQTELVASSYLLAGERHDAHRQRIEEQTSTLLVKPRVEVRRTTRTVAQEISDSIGDPERALVVMTTAAHAHVGPILGSVAEELLEKTRMPTLLLGPNAQVSDAWPEGRMLVCTDGSETAESIIPVAADWSVGLDLHPWVVTVGRGRDLPTGPGDHGLESNAVVAVARDLRKRTGREADFEVLHNDDPVAAIVEHARGYDAALIAMATHGATGLRRIALGSVALGVVHDAPCPVLVGRP